MKEITNKNFYFLKGFEMANNYLIKEKAIEQIADELKADSLIDVWSSYDPYRLASIIKTENNLNIPKEYDDEFSYGVMVAQNSIIFYGQLKNEGNVEFEYDGRKI